MNILKKLPIPISGAMLGVFALGNLLSDYSINIASYSINPKFICGLIGLIFLILIIAKLLKYTEDFVNDLKNPVIASVSATFLMSLIILSSYIAPFSIQIAERLWFLSVLLFIVLIAIFTYHFIIKKFNLEDVYASYYIVYIGIVIASVTAPLYNHISEAMIIFCFGLAAFMFLIIMTAYRYLTLETPDQFKPLICINAAPFALLLLGYLKTYTSISYSFVVFMFVMSIIFYIFAIWKLIEYRNLPFYPSYSAYAFPFVVAAMSTKATVTYLGTKGTYLGISYLNYLTQIQTLIAIILVAYVIVRYVVFLAKN